MSSPKRHHYLPRFYLAGFCRENRVWLYDREKKEVRWQTPKNTAVRTHFYSIENKNGTRTAEIEGMLAKVEGDASPCIEKLRQGEPLSELERAQLAFFMALLRTRVPEFHEFIRLIHETRWKAIMRVLASREGALEGLIEQIPAGEVSAERLREFLRRGEYTVDISREGSLPSMIALAVALGQALDASDWLVLAAPGGTSFVTSDDPVVPIWPRREGGDSGTIGFISPSVRKLIPLAQDTLLIAEGTERKFAFRTTGKSVVRELNLAVADLSDRFVIGRDRALIESMVSKLRLGGRPQKKLIITADGVGAPSPQQK